MSQLARLVLVLLVGAVLCQSTPALALGPSSHVFVARQTLQFLFPQGYDIELFDIVEENPGAFEAGALYPDIFFPIDVFPGDSDYSEFMHWYWHYHDLFMGIQNKYPKPWSAEARRDIAFFLGVIVHSIADEYWHGLRRASRCDDALGRSIRQDNISDFESEFWLDLYLQGTHMIGYDTPDDYFAPVDLAVEILHSQGLTRVQVDHVAYGMAVSYLGVFLEDLIGPTVTLQLRQRMPWTCGYAMDWVCGGIVDNADQSAIEMRLRFANLQNGEYPLPGQGPHGPPQYPHPPGAPSAGASGLDSVVGQKLKGPAFSVKSHGSALSRFSERPAKPETSNPATPTPESPTEHDRFGWLNHPDNPYPAAHTHAMPAQEHAAHLYSQGILDVEVVRVPGGYQFRQPRIVKPLQFWAYISSVSSEILP